MREIKIYTEFEELPLTKVLCDVSTAIKKDYITDEELYDEGVLITYKTSKFLISYEVRLSPRGNIKLELKKSESFGG